jgi:hypothetical protein
MAKHRNRTFTYKSSNSITHQSNGEGPHDAKVGLAHSHAVDGHHQQERHDRLPTKRLAQADALQLHCYNNVMTCFMNNQCKYTVTGKEIYVILVCT